MSGRDGRDDGVRRRALEHDFDRYANARNRFFERLRVDSEVRRLEKSWSLPAAVMRRPGETDPPR